MLIVLLPEQPLVTGAAEPALYWWRFERDGSTLDSGRDGLSALRQRFASERIRALVPASTVNLFLSLIHI